MQMTTCPPDTSLIRFSIGGLIKGLHRCRGLAEAEAMVARFAGREKGGEDLAGLLASVAEGGAVDWVVQVALDRESGSGFRVKSLGPALLRGSSTFMHRAVGCVTVTATIGR
jgi:hypothetical protein